VRKEGKKEKGEKIMRGERKEEEKESGWGLEKSRKNIVGKKKNGIKRK
jgi:hypothetical protein